MSRNDYGLKFGESKQYYGNVPDGRQALANGGSAKGKMPARNKSAPLSRPLPPFGKYYSANNDLPGARPSVRYNIP